MMMLSYLRRGRRRLERFVLDPKVRATGAVMAYGGSGFLLSAASLGSYCQPVAMGLICATTGWRTLVMSLGAMAGYPTFWGSAGNQGIVWSAAAGLLALLVGKKEESREQPLMIPAIGAFLTAVAGLSFLLILEDGTPWPVYLLRVGLSFFCSALFTQAVRCRDAITDWLVGAVAVLALARVSLGPGLGLGYLAAGAMAVGCPFPAAVLAGLSLDLAQITALPMTAVACLASFVAMVPFDRRWKRCLSPGIAWAGICAACGVWDVTPLPALALGGALGGLLPPRPAITRRRGETGAAQVRLELGAEVFSSLHRVLLELEPPPVDEEAILEQVRSHACDGCAARQDCIQRENLTASLLQDPLEADCRKQGRLIPELRRANAQRKLLLADRQRRWEYQKALLQQYRFLGGYLRDLADALPRKAERKKALFRMETGVRTRGKEGTNGDKCLAFAGPECSCFVLLCDGMGTGAEAARESGEAVRLLKKMLAAGFPAAQALESLNSLLVLREGAGAVTVDLARVELDTGHAWVYKWGAAPSYVLSRSGAEKIGTATPPPGIGMDRSHMAVQKLSLRRGEVLILLSDGADGEGIRHLSDLSPDLPPGELAAKLLERGGGAAEDDATAAAIRLRPTGLAAL